MGKTKKGTEKKIRPYGDAEIEDHAARVGGKRNLREVTVSSNGEDYVYLVKKPSRSVMQALADAEQKKDVKRAQKIMISCVLEGDKDAYEHDGDIYITLMETISKLGDEVKATVKKL